MNNIKTRLVVGTAAGVLVALMNGASAQTVRPDAESMKKSANDAHILTFKEQGHSPETDPSAHLIMIDDSPAPQTAAAPATSPAPVAQTMPAPPPVSQAATVDVAPPAMPDRRAEAAPAVPTLAPRADRN